MASERALEPSFRKVALVVPTLGESAWQARGQAQRQK